jgi:hypothetical protein
MGVHVVEIMTYNNRSAVLPSVLRYKDPAGSVLEGAPDPLVMVGVALSSVVAAGLTPTPTKAQAPFSL